MIISMVAKNGILLLDADGRNRTPGKLHDRNTLSDWADVVFEQMPATEPIRILLVKPCCISPKRSKALPDH